MNGGFIECVCVFSLPVRVSNNTSHLRSSSTSRGPRPTKVDELNASGGVQVVLGGSYVHNSGTFLEDLDDAFGRGGV